MNFNNYLFLLILLICLYYISNLIYLNHHDKIANKKLKKIKENKNIPEDFKNFPIYYINLNRSIERNKSFIKNANLYNLKNYHRVEAFDGRNIKKNLYEGNIDGYHYVNNDKKLGKSELAITMSHIKAIKQAEADGHDYAIIMEDDCEPSLVPYWDKSISQIVKEIPEDCELFLLANRFYKKTQHGEIIDYSKLPKGVDPQTGVCYIVTKKGYHKIKQYYDNNKFTLNNKKNIFDSGLMRNLKVYSYNKTLFLLHNFKFTSVENTSKLNFNDSAYKNSYHIIEDLHNKIHI